MLYLKQQMDSELDFQEFLGFYLAKYAYKSITFLEVRLTFNEFVRSHYKSDPAHAEEIVARVNWVAWV